MNKVETKRELLSLPLHHAIVDDKPRIVELLIQTDAVQELDSTSINYLFQLACCYGYVNIVSIFCRNFARKVLSEGFETLFDILIKPTVDVGRPVYPRKLHIIKILCLQFFSDDLDNKKFVEYIQNKFYDAYYCGDVQVMNFLCSIFETKYPPHQWYSLYYQKHMGQKVFSDPVSRYILPNNVAAFKFLLEFGMSKFGTMTPDYFRNIFTFFEHCRLMLFNDILRFQISNSLLIQKSLEVKFSSDLCSHFLSYAGIPCGASLQSLQSILHIYKIKYFE